MYLLLRSLLAHLFLIGKHFIGDVRHAANKLLEVTQHSVKKVLHPLVSWCQKGKYTFRQGEITKFTYQLFKIDKIIQKGLISLVNERYI